MWDKKEMNWWLDFFRNEGWVLALKDIIRSMAQRRKPLERPSAPRGRSRSPKPLPKKMPKLKRKLVEAGPQSDMQSTSSSSALVVKPRPKPVILKANAKASAAQAAPQTSASSKPEATTSSSSVSTVQRPQVMRRIRRPEWVPWPCGGCKLMPWKCTCRAATKEFDESLADSSDSESSVDSIYEFMSKRAGIWDDLQRLGNEARPEVQRADSPEPVEERGMWACPKCKSMNLRFHLVCQVGNCGTRRELAKPLRPGDWMCPVCLNVNFRGRLRDGQQRCNWSRCTTNNWTCAQCGNLNYCSRPICQTRICRNPRPFSYY
jgi:hypothetical protein